MEALQTLGTYLSYPFVTNALIVGVLVALCSSLLGTTLVMKRLSFIGDGLSHVAFGAYAVAAVARVSQNMLIIVPVTVIAAVFLLRRGQNVRVHGDASLAMMSVAALAIGYLMMNVFGTSANVSGDVCSTLFGSTSILTLSQTDVLACAVLSVLVVGAFILLYNRIFAVTFDESFARASGLPVERYNLLVAVMVALVIVVGMNLVGALLLSALIVFPALTAMRLCRTFRGVTIVSSVISVLCALAGMLVSILVGTPVGSTVVLFDAGCYLLICLIETLRGGAG